MPAAIKRAVEAEKAQSGEWTIDTLRIHLLTLIEALADVTAERFTAQKESVERAAAGMDKRLEAINEFRGQLSDQAATFVTRNELNALIDRINMMSSRQDRQEGSGSGLRAGWGFLVGGIGTAAVIVTLIVELMGHTAK